MVKRAYFGVLWCFLTLTAQVSAQVPAQIPDDFDPLEERLKIEGAYIPNYREMMRDVVVALGQYARATRPEFKVFLDGGLELLTRGEWENDLDDLHRAEMAGAKTDDERFLLKLFSPEHPVAAGTPVRRYISAVDGVLLTGGVCGKAKNKPSAGVEKVIADYGLSVIAAEHCATEKERAAAVTALAKKKIPVHADTDKTAAFDRIPAKTPLFLENPHNIDSVAKVRNMLIMTNTRRFSDKDLWVKALGATNYDLLVIEPFFKSNIPLTKDDVKEIRSKKLGAQRLVFAVLNIAEAEDTRLYWEQGWKTGDPAWLRFPSKTNPAGVIVDYWNPAWKRIVGIYFKSIMELGFDGVVLQGVDEHKTFERIIPID